ncbi:peptidylprolyl isomerase [Massilia sp. TS11]|uniref:peptidylprolyl isomerase n=1 Tax=Massilia sp. TS11 TaxID=2908003 RepID=UPI0022AA7E9F|nr:peptidylprolyl isomerase [Massilia sp. TS11]
MHVRRFCASLIALMFAASSFAQEAPAPAPEAPARELPQVLIKTTQGDIVVELEDEKAPKTVDNFLKYVKAGYYKNTIFHRVIKDFMIQTGGYTKDLKPKPGVRKAIPIEDQNGLQNKAYTLAMARSASPNSATSQFFINTVDNPGLDFPGTDGHGYTVFGRVVKGQEVVDKIKAVLVDDINAEFRNVPVNPITITATTVLKTVK